MVTSDDPYKFYFRLLDLTRNFFFLILKTNVRKNQFTFFLKSPLDKLTFSWISNNYAKIKLFADKDHRFFKNINSGKYPFRLMFTQEKMLTLIF